MSHLEKYTMDDDALCNYEVEEDFDIGKETECMIFLFLHFFFLL